MLTKDILENKKSKKKYKMGYSPETLNFKYKVKDIYEEEKPKKKKVDPLYQIMINQAQAKYPYVQSEEDALKRLMQDWTFRDHEVNKKQETQMKQLKKDIADLQDELHELKRTLKQADQGKHSK
jgi:hypothetical protein